MTENSKLSEYSGLLGRATLTPAQGELRFHPYGFNTEPDSKPVFAVGFSEPGFTADEFAKLMLEEVEVAVFDDRAEIIGMDVEISVVLRARSVTANWVSYDVQDYVQRVRQQDEAYERTNESLVDALRKNHKLHTLAVELLRRAELKAAGSEELAARQAAAISLLQRLLRQFESGE